MADIPALPTTGQKPWSLNPHITAINAESTATASTVNTGRLSDSNVTSRVVSLSDTRTVEGLVAGTAAESANRSLIQSMLDDASFKRVFIPEGEWYVGYLSIPGGKELSGVYSRAYTTIPTTGTRLRASNDAQTNPIITLTGRCKISNLAVIGSGMNTAQHNGIFIGNGNGPIVDTVTVAFCASGVDASYKQIDIRGCAIYQNRNDGIRNVLDGFIDSNIINANGARGIYYGNGAGSGNISHNRIEWNNGDGINIFGGTTLTIDGNFIDRNGLCGVVLDGTTITSLTNNTLRRNGRLAQAIVDSDAHIRLSGNTGLVITGNTTGSGGDDAGGAGYVSPSQAVRSLSNTDCVIANNSFRGTTATGWSQVSGTSNTSTIRHSNKLPAGESETYIGASYVTEGSASTVAPAATGTITLVTPPVPVNSTGRVLRVGLSARNHNAATALAATVDLFVSRALTGSATLTTGTINNLAGTSFASTGGTFTVTFSVAADGTSLVVTIVNNAATTHSFTARVN